MAIAINGSGTITGISQGGLNDNIITQSELANTGVAGNGPAFSAYATVGTACTGGASTKILFDSEEFDTNNNFASSRFTPTVAGYYQINASCFIGSASRSSENVIQLYKNGAPYKQSPDTTAYFYAIASSWLVYLNGSTDYVEIYLYVGTGSTTGADQKIQYFQGSMVRAA